MTWSAEDIPATAALVAAAGLMLVIILRSTLSGRMRALLAAIVVCLALWAHLEVGSS